MTWFFICNITWIYIKLTLSAAIDINRNGSVPCRQPAYLCLKTIVHFRDILEHQRQTEASVLNK